MLKKVKNIFALKLNNMPEQTNKFSVGIIGLGVVGRAVKQYYKNAKVFDIDPNILSDKWDELMAQDYIFVCVPTPSKEDGSVDLSAVDNVLKRISAGKKVIIKSTIVPGTTEKLQTIYPQLQLIYIPEFLTARFAIEDFAFPDKNIIGYTKKNPRLASEMARVLPVADTHICTATEAEMIKYSINSYYAMKVIFANEIYDLCEKLDINYNAVLRGVVADKRINDSHFRIFHGKHRGFGGACLPKDTSAIAKRADELGVDLSIIKQAIRTNNKLKKITF